MTKATPENANKIYNKIYKIINQDGENYFSGIRFIDLVKEIDSAFPDYKSYIDERKAAEQSTTRRDFFREIFLLFTNEQQLEFARKIIEETRQNNPDEASQLSLLIGDPPIKSTESKATEAGKHFTQMGDLLSTPAALSASDKSEEIIFIGHGRSKIWQDLKDFLQDRLNLDWDECNREPAAGYSTKERLVQMLERATFSFLIMTAEDEHADETLHARENVIHEIGLFQGRLGFERAIVLFEEGCQEFSNITGLTQIRFPKGDIEARFEQIRRVLEREGILGDSLTSRAALKKR